MKCALLLSALLLTACDYSTVTPVANVAPVEHPKPVGPDGCNVDTSSKLVTEHQVSPIQNLVKEEFAFGHKNECTVKFDITVNGKTYHLEETETGLEQMASVCYYARERARKNLLLDLGGNFKSEANINCRYTDTIGKTER
jgi:hypothetical protein